MTLEGFAKTHLKGVGIKKALFSQNQKIGLPQYVTLGRVPIKVFVSFYSRELFMKHRWSGEKTVKAISEKLREFDIQWPCASSRIFG